MYCVKCGQKLPADARFCMNCGTRTVIESGITEKYRENVYNELAEVALGSLDKDEISLVDSRESAQFITARLDSIQTQLQLDEFLNELTKKWPIYQTVSTQLQKGLQAVHDASIQEVTAESSNEADRFFAQVVLVQKTGMEGVVNDEIFQQAVVLNEDLEKSDNPAIRNHPKKSLMQTFLLPYADAQKARRFLKKRWEDDRLKKGNFTLKFEQKLVVSDFMVLSEKAYVWDLIDYLKIPGITVTMERIILHSPCLPPYFDRVVLEDMFVAMLDDKEDPKAYKEAFSRLNVAYGGYPERVLKQLIRSY